MNNSTSAQGTPCLPLPQMANDIITSVVTTDCSLDCRSSVATCLMLPVSGYQDI